MKAWKGGYYGKRSLHAKIKILFSPHRLWDSFKYWENILGEFVIDFLKGKKNKDHGKQL